MNGFRIRQAGDCAFVVEFEARIEPEINERAICLAEAIDAEGYEGVYDVIPTYASVAVHFDHARVEVEPLRRNLERLAEGVRGELRVERPAIMIPALYDREAGPDLGEVARFGGCSEDDVVRLHSGRIYRVYMLGFLPGNAYMASVDARIAAPRRATPRPEVPAGSIGVAKLQTGISSLDGPYGWQLIARTPVKPFDPTRADPFLLKPGDRVQFVPVTDSTYATLAEGGDGAIRTWRQAMQ